MAAHAVPKKRGLATHERNTESIADTTENPQPHPLDCRPAERAVLDGVRLRPRGHLPLSSVPFPPKSARESRSLGLDDGTTPSGAPTKGSPLGASPSSPSAPRWEVAPPRAAPGTLPKLNENV